MSYFKEVSPESQGIHSQGIYDFLEAVKREGHELHSFMLIRHGKCVAKTWYKPYGPDYMHHIYSFSKSLTATAIGFAWQEGLLSLDEKIIDIFPEEAPEEPCENLKEVTIHHLLTMSCGHDSEIVRDDEHWIKLFLHHTFPYKPGTRFKYNTMGTNMLSAIIQKKTGLDLIDYLKPRLFEPLGITKYDCFCLADGIRHGGGGMKLRTEDMAKFAYFMLHKGSWEGKKLLSGWYEMAGIKQIETVGEADEKDKEWNNGYGYQCWIGSLPNSYRADGAFGQFGFVFPTLDTIIITTAATEQTQPFVDLMYEHLIPAITAEESLPECQIGLEEYFASRTLTPLSAVRNPGVEERLQDRLYVSTEAEDPKAMSSLEQLIGGAGIYTPDKTAINQMAFSFIKDAVIWTVKDGEQIKSIKAAMNNDFAITDVNGKIYTATAAWRSKLALEMEVRRVEGISGVKLIFRFEDDQLTIEADETLVTLGGLGMTEKHVVPFVTAESIGIEKPAIYYAYENIRE